MEVRSLRAQLQSSVQENSALKQLELHKQLEQKLGVTSPRPASLSALSASPQRENFYRRQLLHGETGACSHETCLPCVVWFAVCPSLACVSVCSADPAPSPPVRDIGLFNCGSPGPPYSDLDDSHSTANGVTNCLLRLICLMLCFVKHCFYRLLLCFFKKIHDVFKKNKSFVFSFQPCCVQ